MSDVSEQIIKLLEQGKSSGEIIGMGHKKGTVYGAQRKWREGTGRPSSTVGDTVRCTEQSDVRTPDIESDPDVVQLKKEIRVAELEKQLDRLKAPLDMEAVVSAVREAGRQKRDRCGYLGDDVCDFREWASETEVPAGMGEPILGKGDKWRVNPSPMYCAICIQTIEESVESLAEDLESGFPWDVEHQFSCQCGARGKVAFAVKCTECGWRAWWGKWPQPSDPRRVADADSS